MNQGASDNERVRLLAVGDIMLGDLPTSYGFGVGSQIRKHGPAFPFAHVKNILRSGDVITGNFETVISRFDFDEDPFEDTILRAHPEVMAGLKDCRFTVLNLANNHIMQHGPEPVVETCEHLLRHSIQFVGIESDAPAIKNRAVVDCKGKRFGFLGYNFRPEQYRTYHRLDVRGDIKQVCRDIAILRSEVSNVVVHVHWGDEFIWYPSYEQVKSGRAFIDAGASVVLGHHPHILQGVERYGGGIIAYSLGDFVFDLWQKELRRATILDVFFDPDDVVNYRHIPVIINSSWQPEPLQGEAEEVMREYMASLDDLIPTTPNTLQYRSDLTRLESKERRQTYWYYLRNLHRYRLKRLAENVWRMIRNRLPWRRGVCV